MSVAVISGQTSTRASCALWRALSKPWQGCWRKQLMMFSSSAGQAVQETLSTQELHTPVMLKEVIESLDLRPGEVLLDMTFGAGGHSRAVLSAVPGVTVYALDRDPTAFQLAQQLSTQYPGKIHPVLGRFSEVQDLLLQRGVQPGSLHGVLLDAGCSSMQLDQAERGFSLSKDGPLDMRMDGERCPTTPSAADVVNALNQQALTSILSAYGEERHAKKIASAIVTARSIYPISRTQQLASIVAGAFSSPATYARHDLLQRPAHVATKTFQALRIFVNNELHELLAGLQAAEALLGNRGRLCVLTFHSLEDRVAKRFLLGQDVSAPPRRSLRQHIRQGREEEEEGEEKASSSWMCVRKKVMTPQAEEVQKNPRGRSAKLRVALRA